MKSKKVRLISSTMAKVTRPKARINLGLQKEYDRNEIERMSFKKYRETFFCLHSTYNELLTMPKALTLWITINCGKI